MSGPEISPQTTVGAVHLTVSDLERSLAYYRAAIGLEVLGREDGRASVGVGDRELLALLEEPGAPRRTATPGSSTSRCSFPRASSSRAGWRTPAGTASSSPGSPTTT